MTETLCIAADVTFAAGTNVSSALTSGQYTKLINGAEGQICMETKVNWVTRYSSLSADYKEVLRVAAESYSALGAATFDPNSYLSFTEYQNILDVNTYKYERAVSKLKEKTNADFLVNGESN